MKINNKYILDFIEKLFNNSNLYFYHIVKFYLYYFIYKYTQYNNM